jgi:cold-inducible RNA-binding protein
MSVKTLFVGNIPYSATEAELMEHFADYGGNNVRIIEGRGFAFVDVEADRCGAAIEEKHNTEMNGRRLNVDEARPRQNGGGGGGGGGGGYRGGGGGGGYGGDRRRY